MEGAVFSLPNGARYCKPHGEAAEQTECTCDDRHMSRRDLECGVSHVKPQDLIANAVWAVLLHLNAHE
jgi:hypothetical protein